MLSAVPCPYFQKAFGWCVPIGGLAGLVGLGGGEFRLPVLMYVVGYPARTAVPLNLAVSLVTLTVALLVRSRTLSELIQPNLTKDLHCQSATSRVFGDKSVFQKVSN